MNLTRVAIATTAHSAPRHLSNIQILRGVAALMVLIYHIGNELGEHGLAESGPLFWTGSAGVDIFFVISGFIMVHSSAAAFAKPGAPGLFLARRVVRLVPLYWFITTISVLAKVWAAGGAGLPGRTWRWFAASYAFLFYPHEGRDFPLYTQGWTLNFEMFFYFCFAAALLLRRAAALWAMSVGLTALAILGLIVALPWPVDRWANTNIIEFVLGMALAEAHRRDFRLPLPTAIALAAGGFVVFYLSVASVDAWLPYRGFVWGPPALAVAAASTLYRPRRRQGPIRTALEKLGDASYSLYLVHYAFFVGLGRVLEHFVKITEIPPLLYCTALFAGAIGLAFITYGFLEQPATRGLNRALGLSRRWRALTADAPEAI
jgi:exopolysaccharide production protein ExoZ